MLAEVARHADHLLGQLEHAAQMRIGKVEAGFVLDMAFVDRAAPSAPDGARQHGGNVLGQAHRLAHLANRHARAIVDHRSAQAGPMAAVFAVEILDHLLAPLMLEIDIDVGRLLAVFGDETVEQELVLFRIDAGDAEAIADGRIGRASSPLTQDRRIDLLAREIDDVLDGQEIARKLHLPDQREFLVQRIAQALGNAFGIAPGGPLPGLAFEIALRIDAAGIKLLGIFVFQRVETEIAGVGHFARGGDGVRPAGEHADHGGRRFQVPLGIAEQQVPGLRHRGLVTDGGHHVLQGPLVGRGVMHVVGGEDAQAVGLREMIEPLDPFDIACGVEIARGDMAQCRQLPGEV